MTIAAPAPFSFTADRGDDRRRIDRVVMRHLGATPGLSRTLVQTWVDQGRVHVDGRPARRPAQRVTAGQALEVTIGHARPARARPVPQNVPLAILYEDETLLVLDKPAGLVVHPSYRQPDGTLLNGLLHHGRHWKDGRPSLVQRLDKHTSGVLVVARSAQAHARLAQALAERETSKVYLAVCRGVMRDPHRRLRYALGRDPQDRRRVIVCDGGRNAVTDVQRLAVVSSLTLVACRLRTGRTHQIRVHLQAAGLPLVGDPVYGGDAARRGAVRHPPTPFAHFPRQALHAWRLSFTHPWTRAHLHFQAPVPDDLRQLLQDAGFGDAGAPSASYAPSLPGIGHADSAT
jgi:23S rRNA pseudouridine1911/1915/1917 synthase